MSRLIRSVALIAVVFAGATPWANAGDIDIGVTITGEIVPGVYGRVDLANRPAPPPVVYAQPVIIERAAPTAVRIEPIYLHVPPGHAKNWRRHCHEYHACNRPVYFVRSAEYEPGYRPGYDRPHEHHDHDAEEHDRYDHDRDHHDHGDHDHGDHGEHGDHGHGDHDHDRGYDHDR